MGQKINPKSLRVGVTKNWSSRWFFFSLPDSQGKKVPGGTKMYAKFLEQDETIRNTIMEKISTAGVAGIDIERTPNDVKIFIKAARPGLVIGRGGKGIEELTASIEKNLKKVRGRNSKNKSRLSVNVEELKRSEVSAAYVAQQIAWDLERRLPFRRTMKKYLGQLEQNRDVKGAKIRLAGRLGGGDIARAETVKFGALPLQTIRANIDYGTATATDAYGTMGIKVWLYTGEKAPDDNDLDTLAGSNTQ